MYLKFTPFENSCIFNWEANKKWKFIDALGWIEQKYAKYVYYINIKNFTFNHVNATSQQSHEIKWNN